MRRNRLLIGLVTIVVGWIAIVTVMIAGAPDDGVTSPAELRERLERALNTRDAAALSDLLRYPPGDAEDFATAYVDTLRDAGASGITVALRPSPHAPRVATIRGKRADGDDFSYDLAVSQDANEWRITFTPPL